MSSHNAHASPSGQKEKIIEGGRGGGGSAQKEEEEEEHQKKMMKLKAMASSEKAFGDDEIFYGSVPVALSMAPGHCEAYDHARAALATSPEEVAVSRARAGKLSVGGKTNAVVPCMPCVDIRQPAPPAACTDVSTWPKLLQQPLIKVPLDSPAAVKGVRAVASGCRSCLAKLDGDWYRLKGSGNHDQGFILKEDKALDVVQIRGCAFSHTAARENYMTSKLAGELAGCAVPTNEAMGSFVYGPPNQPLGGTPTPDGVSVTPTCIVQRTRGDRRLGSHLLAGLSILLPELVSKSSSESGGDERADSDSLPPITVESLKQLFPQLRPLDPADGTTPVTTAVLMTDHSLGIMYGAGNGLSFQMPRNSEVFANVTALKVAEHAPLRSQQQQQQSGRLLTPKGSGERRSAAAAASHDDPAATQSKSQQHDDGTSTSSFLKNTTTGGTGGPLMQITNDGLEPASAPWCTLWDLTVAELEKDLEEFNGTAGKKEGGTEGAGAESILVYLYSRIGYDCGRFARGLHKVSRVSWGTYADAMCFEGQLHCNAHANNMVVLAPRGHAAPTTTGTTALHNDGASACQHPVVDDFFLSFLDLDMAFGDDDYLDTWGSGKVGIDAAEFDDLLQKENVNFMEVLVGADANLGVPATAQEYVRSFSDEIKLLQTVLYDALMLGYQRAYTGDTACYVAAFDPVKHRIAYHYIRLALIKMANFVA